MAYSRSFTLVRARGFGALPDLLEQRAGERAMLGVFESEGLPIALRDQLDTPMPIGAMMGLFARSAGLLGQRTFGLDVGAHMSHDGYGLWAQYSSQAATLGRALQRSVISSSAHLSGCRLELVPEAGRYVWRFVTPRFPLRMIEHSDHVLPPMLNLVRVYLGETWRPEWVEVNYARDPDAGKVERRLQIPMRFEGPGVGFVLRPEDLTRRRPVHVPPPRRAITLRDVEADVTLRNAPEPARALSAVIALRLLDGASDIEGAAHLVGISVQSLQRRLRQHGYTYREVLDLVRRDRAVGLLTETQLSVLEIALALGYEDHGNFTRAFTRWLGCTPSAFRRMRCFDPLI
ncbi:AraC family transcriptional regulator [Ancylobacter sp. MQZ15Z-1]|uniref:AraC family transcriptional regulator n=1 Tax=Ancylobacter mangrovi TaxID=2972472 RepID=A0A9X2PFK1_9HYPH|nr:AraC family transcriptional regulator [Ancylobacter mangrovi]MCS0495273.1 AraC family transcriptional regulator [Ancylobacter mangrovi]